MDLWTEDIANYVRLHYVQMFDEEIAESLTRLTGVRYTANAVKKYRQREGLTKSRGRGKCERATPAETALESLRRRIELLGECPEGD
jgi:hypothetical protein